MIEFRQFAHLFVPLLFATFAALGPLLLWPLVLLGYIICEVLFIKSKRLFSLSAIRVSIFTLVVGFAYIAPVKYLDREVKPSDFELVSYGKKSILKGPNNHIWLPSVYSEKDISLSNKSSSFRSFLKDLEKQTGLTHNIYYCGTGATLLYGASPTHIGFRKKSPNEVKNENVVGGSDASSRL